ncbi:MAG: phosphate-starvation-inducible PsiE family protein [Proteobacteria bacterium]|nr:phosphate-starvation-inducible PsiE family protein [Pseudomonadota bacterium]
MDNNKKIDLVDFSRVLLIKIDVIFHIIAAFILLVICGIVLYKAVQNSLSFEIIKLIEAVNEVLLALIILEILWTIIRFLKKQKFSLVPFLDVGIIASVRRILLIEVQTSTIEHPPIEKLYEIMVSAGVILALVIAYFIIVKAQKYEN